jgi:hypothetical protein
MVQSLWKHSLRTHPIHLFVDHSELAAEKLWAVYISEAEKYDKALVEGRKSDMDGLLIFVRPSTYYSNFHSVRPRLGSFPPA